jgi:type IV secretory pathway VirB9-like protein
VVTPAVATANKCEVIRWTAGDVSTVYASRWKASHIILPEKNLDVIVGNSDLWDVSYVENHVWIKPNSSEWQGAETTISYVSQSNQSYEFLVKRANSKADKPICYTIEPRNGLINQSAWRDYTTTRRSDQVAAMAQSVARKQVASSTRQIVEQTQDALRRYRMSIYTDYDVETSKAAGINVTAVYDDGRFTFIRLADDAPGLVAVYGEVDGKEELLEYKYDAPTKVFQVSGIFPTLKMRSDKAEIRIARKG